jgi:putative ABC transport system permease protein
MDHLLKDLRHGVRMLRRSPGFALVALVVFALGIGANAAIFSVVHAVLLQPLPYPDPSRLVRVWHTPPQEGFPGRKTFAVSNANYLDWEAQNHVFEKMALIGFASLNASGDGEPQAIPGARVTENFFTVLGARPALGRTLTPGDFRPGAEPAIVLGDALWRTRFGADPHVVGREIRLNDQAFRVVGVMRPADRLPDFASAWVPYVMDAKDRAVRVNHNFLTVARLKPGVSLAAAQSEMNVISDRLAKQYPEDDAGWGALVVPLRDDLVGDVRPLLLVLLGAVGFVLLIACANVGNLLLARTLARRREIAVRAALGASRRRLLGQLVAESLLLSLAGGALGLALATFGLPSLVALLADRLPRAAEVRVSVPVLAFTTAISALTGLLAGIVPAWGAMRHDLARALQQGSARGTSEAGRRTRGVLVVAEVALALVLLTGAGLLVRSLWLLNRVDPGFDPRGVVRVAVILPRERYATDEKKVAFFHTLLERLRAIPGVETAGATSSLPLNGNSNWPVAFDGRPTPPVSQQPNVVTQVVAGDYFRTLRIPVKRGRVFDAHDDASAPGVVVVSEAMARRFWPGEDPIGKRLTTAFFPEKTREVVGIVGDVKLNGLEVLEPVSAMYVPFEQIPTGGLELAMRTRAPGATVKAATAAVRALDPAQPVIESGPLEEILAASLSRQRFGVQLLGGFAALALVLAAVGIASVLAYSVRRRRREIGIRMALGARAETVLGMIVLQGMRTTLIGVAVGLGGALALARLLGALLYGVGPADPATLGAVVAVLCLVALAACFIPAMRAGRIDPLRALREE